MTFGEFYRSKRELIAGVVDFAKMHNLYDSHVSCYENGVKKPPMTKTVIERHAVALGLAEKTEDWYTFYELAAAETGQMPLYVQNADQEKVLKVMRKFRDC